MDVVLNDYSIDAQFDSIEAFVDSLVDNTFLVLNYMDEKSHLLLKMHTTFNRQITEKINIYQFLSSQQFMGFPESQKLRSFLSNLVSEPYWNDNPKTDVNSIYKNDIIGTFNGNEPNCMSEALERDGYILSFEHDSFKQENISLIKNEMNYILYNMFDKHSAAKNLFLTGQIGFVDFLLSGVSGSDMFFYGQGSKYYADEYYDSGKLSKDDALSIKKDFDLLIDGRICGNVLSRLVDSVNYKGITYNEFRTSLSDNREYRIYYYVDGSKWVFLDSLLKTTPTIPEHIKRKTYNLIIKYKNKMI